jgi:hypothetical protein
LNLRDSRTTHDPPDAALQPVSIEVDQQADLFVCRCEIGNNLALVDAIEPFDGLYLDDDLILDDQVDSVAVHHLIAVFDDDRLLALEFQLLVPQLDASRLVVDAFAEAGTETFVNLQGAADDPVDNVFEFRGKWALHSSQHEFLQFLFRVLRALRVLRVSQR